MIYYIIYKHPSRWTVDFSPALPEESENNHTVEGRWIQTNGTVDPQSVLS